MFSPVGNAIARVQARQAEGRAIRMTIGTRHLLEDFLTFLQEGPGKLGREREQNVTTSMLQICESLCKGFDVLARPDFGKAILTPSHDLQCARGVWSLIETLGNDHAKTEQYARANQRILTCYQNQVACYETPSFAWQAGEHEEVIAITRDLLAATRWGWSFHPDEEF